jgi:hypothetical protein
VNFSCDALKRFQCENRRCVPRYQLCDGIDNCGDGSDENNMTLCASRLKPCNLYAEYQCANKKCVDRSRVCDFADDCGDSSDELGCRKCLYFPGAWTLNFTVAWITHNVQFILFFIIIYLSWSWATCWPVRVSHVQKPFQRSAIVRSASQGVVFHYPR